MELRLSLDKTEAEIFLGNSLTSGIHVMWFPFAQFPALDSVPIGIFRRWGSCFRGLFSDECF